MEDLSGKLEDKLIGIETLADAHLGRGNELPLKNEDNLHA
jgi:hypothetical protein